MILDQQEITDMLGYQAEDRFFLRQAQLRRRALKEIEARLTREAQEPKSSLLFIAIVVLAALAIGFALLRFMFSG